MSNKALLLRNTLIIGFGKIFTAMVGFLLLPLYTRYLSVEQYGLMDLIVVYTALIAPILNLRLELAVFRWLIDRREHESDMSEVISNVLYLLLLGSAAFTGMFAILAQFIPIPHASLVCAYIIIMSLSSTLTQVARGMGRVNTYVIAGSIVGVATAIFTVLLVVLFGLLLKGALISLIVSQLIAMLYTIISLRLWKYMKSSWSKKLNKEMLQFSVPMIPNNISWWLTFAFNKVYIAKVLGLASSGIYAVSQKFMLVFTGLYDIFNLSWTEAASVNIDKPDHETFFSDTFNVVIRVFGTCLLLILASVPIIFPFIVSGDYDEAYLYIPVMLAAVFVNMINRFISAIYVAKRKTKEIMYSTGAAAAISVALNILLIPKLKIWGAAISLFAAYSVIAIHRFRDVQQYTKLRIDSRSVILMVTAFLIVSAIYYQKSLLLSAASILLVALLAVFVNMRELRFIQRMILGKYLKKGQS